MAELRIAWSNLLFRPVLTIVAAAILGVAVALAIAVLLLSRAMEDGLVRASRPFDLLVGAKGSPTQLIMSTILLQDAPVGNIPFHYFETLRRDPRVAHAVPLAMGDSVHGFPYRRRRSGVLQADRSCEPATVFRRGRGPRMQEHL